MPITDFLRLPPSPAQPFSRPFVKMQGLRNHFVFVDLRNGEAAPSSEDIIRICDVHEGVGAEQVITIEPPRNGGDVFMGIFNTDGTEAQACGNATRCLAYLVFDETGKEEILIDSRGGPLHCVKMGSWDVSVTLGPIYIDMKRIPLESGPLKEGMALSIGNPHAVFFVPSRDAIDIPSVAPAIAADALFPEGVNVGVAEAIDERTLKLAVWERPGMLTEACGTGACVAAFAGRERGLLKGNDFTVHLPGGTLNIKLLDDGRAVMTGPVAFCCVGYA